jgi:hypothetical protein
MTCSRCKEPGHNIATCTTLHLEHPLEYEEKAISVYLKVQDATAHDKAIEIIRQALLSANDDGARNPCC